MREHTMRLIKALTFAALAIPMLAFNTGCAMHSSEEAMQRADRALEQAELCNQRVDKLSEMYGGK